MRRFKAINREIVLDNGRYLTCHPDLFTKQCRIPLKTMKAMFLKADRCYEHRMIRSNKTYQLKQLQVYVKEVLYRSLAREEEPYPLQLPLLFWPPALLVRYATMGRLSYQDKVFELVKEGSFASHLKAIFLIAHEKHEFLPELDPIFDRLVSAG